MLKKVYENLERGFLVVTLAFSCCLVLMQVIMRYLFNNPLIWSEEVARFLFIWQVWIGIAYATRRRSHLRITMVRDRLPGKVKIALELVVVVVWFGFGLFLAFKGFDMCGRVARLGQQSAALRIPMQYVYAGIPVGALLMDIHLVEYFVALLKGGSFTLTPKEGETNE